MIDSKTLNAVLNLCRLNVSQEEKENFKTQIGDVLDYFELLNNIDTKDVNLDLGIAITQDQLREDVPGKSMTEEEIMKFADNFEDGFFIVPKILDTVSKEGA